MKDIIAVEITIRRITERSTSLLFHLGERVKMAPAKLTIAIAE
jgi:hypothetical protein